MKKVLLLALVLLCIFTAYASEQDIIDNAKTAAENAEIPEGLTEHEAEIYRQGYAVGFHAALNPDNDEGHYIVNNKSNKFHLPSCNGVAAMNPENRQDFYGTREEAMAKGYSPCGLCDP